MTFHAVAALVMISGPADTEQEVEAVRATIAKWNSSHARDEGVVFVPQHYSTDTVPVLRAGVDGQAIINEQITNHADVILALFKYRLGTPTPRNEYSGTVEEAEARSETGMAHMFFWQGDSLPMTIAGSTEKMADWGKLKTYRETFHENTSGLYHTYNSLESLIDKVEATLWRDARILKTRGNTLQPVPAASVSKLDLEVSLDENEVWHHPDLPEFIEVLIDNELEREKKREGIPSANDVIARSFVSINSGSSVNPAEEMEGWTARTRANLASFDEKIAAAAALPIKVALSTSKVLKDLEVEFVFYGVRGLDPTEDRFTDIWTPLRKSKSSHPPFGVHVPDFPAYNLILHSSWDTVGDDVVLTVSVPDLRRQVKPYESEPAVVLMVPFDQTGIEEIRYSWRATAMNVEGEAEGDGSLPVMQSGREDVIEWMKSHL